MLKVSAMRIPLAVTIISVAMLASPLAYGQAASGKGQPSRPAVSGSDRILIPPTPPAIAPPSDALSNLAGGGYADPNYVPPRTHSKKTTRHRVLRAPRRGPRAASSNTASIRLSRIDTVTAATISAAGRDRAHAPGVVIGELIGPRLALGSSSK